MVFEIRHFVDKKCLLNYYFYSFKLQFSPQKNIINACKLHIFLFFETFILGGKQALGQGVFWERVKDRLDLKTISVKRLSI